MKKGQQPSKHPHKALSATGIRQLVKSGKPGKFADGNGLYLVISHNGTKKWVWRTTIGGRRRELGVGGDNVSLAEARDTAAELALKLRRGEDILTQRREERIAIPSFKESAYAAHEHHSQEWKNAKHGAQWINTLRDYAFPVFGDLPVNEVETDHVMKALTPIWHEKPETAKRVRQRIGAVLDWATVHKHRSGENPIASASPKRGGLAKQSAGVKHHAALPYSQIPEFIDQVHGLDESAEIIRLGLEFTILTAARTGEVRYAQTQEVQGKDWIIPAERMKAKRAHRVPLSIRSREILKQAALIAGPASDYLFPNPRTGKPLSENAFLQLLDQMGKKGVITVHGFRSSFRDWASEKTRYPSEVSEAALAHTIRNKVEAAYRRTDHLEARRELMETWAVHCTQSGSVVPFSRQRGA
jgi:integrase